MAAGALGRASRLPRMTPCGRRGVLCERPCDADRCKRRVRHGALSALSEGVSGRS